MIVKVTDIVNGDEIVFSNGYRLYSYHAQDCCEYHYLDFEHIDMSDFEDVEFDISDDSFFNVIGDYGIELVPIKGYTVKIPGYGSNNGYYSANLTLVLVDKDRNDVREYDVTDGQDVDWH